MTPWKTQLPDRSKAPEDMQNTDNEASDESNGNTKNTVELPIRTAIPCESSPSEEDSAENSSSRDNSDGVENASSLGLDGSNDGRGRRTRNMSQPPAPPAPPPAAPALNPSVRGSGIGGRGSRRGTVTVNATTMQQGAARVAASIYPVRDLVQGANVPRTITASPNDAANFSGVRPGNQGTQLAQVASQNVPRILSLSGFLQSAHPDYIAGDALLFVMWQMGGSDSDIYRVIQAVLAARGIDRELSQDLLRRRKLAALQNRAIEDNADYRATFEDERRENMTIAVPPPSVADILSGVATAWTSQRASQSTSGLLSAGNNTDAPDATAAVSLSDDSVPPGGTAEGPRGATPDSIAAASHTATAGITPSSSPPPSPPAEEDSDPSNPLDDSILDPPETDEEVIARGYPPRPRWYCSPLHEETGRYMRREVGRDALSESVGAVAERSGGVGVVADDEEKREGHKERREGDDGQGQGDEGQGERESPSVAMGLEFEEEVAELGRLFGLLEDGEGDGEAEDEEDAEGGAEGE